MNKEDNVEALTPRRCCACGELKSPCRTIGQLNLKAPKGSSGWGCMVCHLPMEGAMVVVCDECNERFDREDETLEIRWAIAGDFDSDDRVLISELTEPHEHNPRFHPEMTAAMN